MVDVNNPELASQWNSVKQDSGEINWALFGYSDDWKAIEPKCSGTGGLAELKDNLPADKILFGGFRCMAVDADSRRAKFVFVTWVGEDVAPLKRARVSTHKPIVQGVLRGAHLDFHVTEQDELTEDLVKQKILASSGAHQPERFEF